VLINEVEHIVGLSKKSIRYYESNGLLTPKRNSNNDYRLYDENDIEKLKKIKFLRELGVTINEIKAVDSKELDLSECLKDRVNKILREEENYKKIKSMCNEIIDSKNDFDTIEIEGYFQKINILGKEGFTMRDVKTNKTKKIIGAILSSIIFSAMFVLLIVTITWAQFTMTDKIPWIIYVVLMTILGAPVIGIVGNLITRIAEILGGEEDEASKY